MSQRDQGPRDDGAAVLARTLDFRVRWEPLGILSKHALEGSLSDSLDRGQEEHGDQLGGYCNRPGRDGGDLGWDTGKRSF